MGNFLFKGRSPESRTAALQHFYEMTPTCDTKPSDFSPLYCLIFKGALTFQSQFRSHEECASCCIGNPPIQHWKSAGAPSITAWHHVFAKVATCKQGSLSLSGKTTQYYSKWEGFLHCILDLNANPWLNPLFYSYLILLTILILLCSGGRGHFSIHSFVVNAIGIRWRNFFKFGKKKNIHLD